MTERDKAILSTVHRYRVLDSQQVQSLLFPTDPRKARLRLERLSTHGYLERLSRPYYPEQPKRAPAYRLTALGARFMAGELGIPLAALSYWRTKPKKHDTGAFVHHLYLEHMLMLSEIRMTIEQQVATAGCAIPVWRDEVDVRRANGWDDVVLDAGVEAERTSMRISPDSYFVLDTSQGHRGHLFLEADRGTETLTHRWKHKILGYKALLSSGMFHRNYHAGEGTAFRVLVTVLSPRRAANLKATVERVGDPELSRIFMIAQLSDVKERDVLHDPFWLRGSTTVAEALINR